VSLAPTLLVFGDVLRHFLEGQERDALAVTSSKVIHQPAEEDPSEGPQPPPVVNNFAVAPVAAVDKLSLSAQADGGSAPDVTRSALATIDLETQRDMAYEHPLET
jgi:hypothetical protein